MAKKFSTFMEPEGSTHCSRKLATVLTFDFFIFYGHEDKDTSVNAVDRMATCRHYVAAATVEYAI
jgi:hypothetical protein